MQGNIEQYSAPTGDLLEVMKNYELLHNQFKKIRFMIVTAPLML